MLILHLKSTIREQLEFQVYLTFLSGGLLTGKYKLENNDFAGIGRLSTFKHQTRKLRQKDIFQRYKLASEFCKENNVNLMEMAFAYVYSKIYRKHYSRSINDRTTTKYSLALIQEHTFN